MDRPCGRIHWNERRDAHASGTHPARPQLPPAGQAGGRRVLPALLWGPGRAAGVAAVGRQQPVCPARSGPAAAGYHRARGTGPYLQRRRGAAGRQCLLLDPAGLPPGNAGGEAGTGRPGPGFHPGAGQRQPAGTVQPPGLQRLSAALPGGPRHRRCGAGLLPAERDHRHPHQPGYTAVVSPGGAAGLGAGLHQCGQRRRLGAGAGVRQPAGRPGRRGADRRQRLGLHPVPELCHTAAPGGGQQPGADHRHPYPALPRKRPGLRRTGAQRRRPRGGHRAGCEHRGGAGHGHHPGLRPQPAPRGL